MPGCTNCIQSTGPITGFNPAGCFSAPSCNVDASCIIYTGPNLTCSGVNTYDALDVILQKIDPLLCTGGSGDYSSYNTFCLAPISTQKQFVETISNFVCNLQTTVTTFIGTTFPAYQASVTAAITAVNSPGITCSVSGVISSDTIPTILSKYCTTITNLSNNLQMAGVNWNSCYTVSPTPTTLTQAFNALIGQICLLKSQVSAAAVLPFFNNTATCLSGGTNNDSLVQTINLMITRLCQTPTLDNSLISWGCLTQPAGNQDLNTALLNIVGNLNVLNRVFPFQWSNDFTVTNVDNTNLCLGKHIALATPSQQDRFVAATTSDLSPGTLQQKVTAGTNVSLDFSTTPGQMIINTTGGSGPGNGKVLVDTTDTVADFLINKIEPAAAVGGIGLTILLDTSNTSHQAQIGITLDGVTLMTALLNAVSTNPALQTLFCQTVSACPSPCAAPTNVTVTYTPGTSTTSTTTTTTTT